MPKNTQYVPTGGLIDTLSSNEKSGRFLQNSPNFLGTYNHSSSLSNTQPLQHTASFKEEGSSSRDTPDGQLHMSFKPSAGGGELLHKPEACGDAAAADAQSGQRDIGQRGKDLNY